MEGLSRINYSLNFHSEISENIASQFTLVEIKDHSPKDQKKKTHINAA